MAEANEYRLPTNVKPVHYDLVIKTDLEKLEFYGFVRVSLDVKADTSSITINSSGLELSKASIYSDALNQEHRLSNPIADDAQQRVTFEVPAKLPADSKAQFKVLFKGKLTGDLNGYFKVSWVDEGKTKHYSLTQFEPTSARRAFPCWDEPELKATFSVSLISRANTTNLGNMPVVSEHVIASGSSLSPGIDTGIDVDQDIWHALLAEEQGDNDDSDEKKKWKLTKFDKTPLMPTYIVAFANGEFAYLEDFVVMPLSGKTVPLRVYATKNVVAQGQYTLEVKKAALPLYEKVFDVEYPLPKLDTLVADDFLGAMENWGIILGSSNYLLIDPERASVKEKKQVVGMESHEIAHMWFGNITTLKWWNYLYLNEGFATLMGEVIIPNKIYPEWRVNTEFIVNHLSKALTLDAKPSSHPIEVDVPDANHVVEIFDALSYSKAASVLRMLSAYIGEDVFLKGVSIYLKKHLFGNTSSLDLWEGISEVSGLNISELMENWISKIGFPVLSVTEVEEKDGQKGIIVRQDRFLETGRPDKGDNETIWNVPLAILSARNGKPVVDNQAILQEREKFFPVNTNEHFKLNADTNGVYRVLYSPERLAKIGAEAVNTASIFSLDDRLGLVLDAVALSKAGLAKLSVALSLVEQLKDEKEYPVWQGIADNLEDLISAWWEYPEIIDKLNAFRRSLFIPFVQKLGYDYPGGEDSDKALLRTLAVGQASASGDERVIAELKSRFQHFLDTGDDSKIPVELQAYTFATAVQHGGRAEYEAMLTIYDSPKTPQARLSAVRGLSSPQDENLLRETFTFISTKARGQDIREFFRQLPKNFRARRLLTKYTQDQYDVLYDRFNGSFLLRELLPASVSFYSSKDDLEAVEAFFKDKDTSKYRQTLEQAFDGIRARIGLIERSTQDLKEWLASRQ